MCLRLDFQPIYNRITNLRKCFFKQNVSSLSRNRYIQKNIAKIMAKCTKNRTTKTTKKTRDKVHFTSTSAAEQLKLHLSLWKYFLLFCCSFHKHFIFYCSSFFLKMLTLVLAFTITTLIDYKIKSCTKVGFFERLWHSFFR